MDLVIKYVVSGLATRETRALWSLVSSKRISAGSLANGQLLDPISRRINQTQSSETAFVARHGFTSLLWLRLCRLARLHCLAQREQPPRGAHVQLLDQPAVEHHQR